MNLAFKYCDLPQVEREVTELYACGLTKKEIAILRGRSTHTIDNQLKNIFIKTGTRKDTELAAWYFCTRYNLSLNLPENVRKLIAFCLLALVGIGMYNEQKIIRFFLSSRYARVRAPKRNDNNYYI
jgi:DNA-binding CsgD family transcriptional regulator